MQTIHFNDETEMAEFSAKLFSFVVNLRFNANYYNNTLDPKAKGRMKYYETKIDEMLVCRGISIHQQIKSIKILKNKADE